MASYKFFLKDAYSGTKQEKEQRIKEGKTPLLKKHPVSLYLIVTFNRDERLRLKTSHKIKPENWDFKREQVKGQVTGAFETNESLNVLKYEIKTFTDKLTYHNQYTFQEIKPLLKEFIQKKTQPQKQSEKITPFIIFEKYIESRKDEVSHRTIQKFKTTKTILENFIKEKKEYKDLNFRQIDSDFILKLKHYLHYEIYNAKTKKNGFFNDTANKYLKALFLFLKFAKKHNYYNGNAHEEKNIKIKSRNDIVVMKLDEVNKLKELDLSQNKRLEKTRDLFLFATYTGQRWGDIENFKKDQIISKYSAKLGKEVHYWKFTIQKTKTAHELPLIGFCKGALSILEKYDFELPNDISNQKFNDYIKEVGEKAKLNRKASTTRMQGSKEIKKEQELYKFMSSHMGRRNCASIMLNEFQVSIDKVQQITKHQDINTLLKYIHQSTEALEAELISKTNLQGKQLKTNDKK